MKILSVGAEFFNVDELMCMNLIVSFPNFATTPKNDTTVLCARFALANNESMQ